MSEPKTASIMPEHDFTIVIPVFNMADTIGRCLESITALDYDPEAFEVIVVDNMSTDETREIVAKFPVKVLEEKVFQSSYAARNTGIAAARGKLIAFTDADCVVDRAWLDEIAREAGDEFGGLLCRGDIVLSADDPGRALFRAYRALASTGPAVRLAPPSLCTNRECGVSPGSLQQGGVFSSDRQIGR